MKLEKAKEILSDSLKGTWPTPNTDFNVAVKLGAEGINFKQAWQKGQYFPPDYLLPGETKE